MAPYAENMEDVSEDVPVNEWLHVAVKSVTEAPSKSSGRDQATIQMIVQDEPHVGTRYVTFLPTRVELHRLKKFYTACEYRPGAEGHDPQKTVGAELWIKPVPQKNPIAGMPSYTIPEWNMRPFAEGKPRD